MNIILKAHPQGTLLPVRAQPPEPRVAPWSASTPARLKVAVTAAPEDGKANRAIRDLLAAALGLKRAQLRLYAGAASREKVFLVIGLEPGQLARRIELTLADDR